MRSPWPRFERRSAGTTGQLHSGRRQRRGTEKCRGVATRDQRLANGLQGEAAAERVSLPISTAPEVDAEHIYPASDSPVGQLLLQLFGVHAAVVVYQLYSGLAVSLSGC